MTDLIITSAQYGQQFLNSDWGRLAINLAVEATQNVPTTQGRRLSDMPVLRGRQGGVIPKLYGRMRLGGQLLWASEVQEHVHRHETGGKSSGPDSVHKEYAYSLSFAIALCEGPIANIGRIWIDGVVTDLSSFTHRIYKGTKDQNPNPKIQQKMGADQTPAYRGLAYIVFEDVDIGAYGNRIPQFNFEVFTQTEEAGNLVKAVNIIPGSTEFGYDPAIVIQTLGKGRAQVENTRLSATKTDWELSLDDLQENCPSCEWVSLVVTWFGDDLRADHLTMKPRVVSKIKKTAPYIWAVSGLHRPDAQEVSQYKGRPAFDGTPNDLSVVKAIKDLKQRGFKVMLYPFLMMDISGSNTRPGVGGQSRQPAYPWRGYIQSSQVSPNTAQLDKAMNRFFYGPSENPARSQWGLAHMVEHYAQLCAQAGGVDAFLLGTEFKNMSRLTDGTGDFPFARHLIALAERVRRHLPMAKLSYAADWSEYGAIYDNETDNLDFPLDAFWAHAETDFIGIDNYLPLSDWREGHIHLDAQAGYTSIYDPAYLPSQIEGGQYYDWYYEDEVAREKQTRTPITDTLDKPFVHRQKDLRGWWQNQHYPRFEGREQSPTAWVASSKPIWFTELGCPAVDKGSNEPNKFPDAKSSDGGLPYASTGQRDDEIQRNHIKAWANYWAVPENNPVSPEYGGAMIDVSKFFLWAWDARPYPVFPLATDIWVDGVSWATGHWLNGRQSSISLKALVSGLSHQQIDYYGGVGSIEGYLVNDLLSPRELLEPLMQAFSLDFCVNEQEVGLKGRQDRPIFSVTEDEHVVTDNLPVLKQTRMEKDALAQLLRLSYMTAEGEYEVAIVESWRADQAKKTDNILHLQLPLVLSETQAQTIVDRLLAELWIAREKLQINLPPHYAFLKAGDFLQYQHKTYRITKLTDLGYREIEAEGVEPSLYAGVSPAQKTKTLAPQFNNKVFPIPEVSLMELPDFSAQGSSVPYIAAFCAPWRDGVDVVPINGGWQLRLSRAATMGETLTPLQKSFTGRWDKGQRLEVVLNGGRLVSRTQDEVLAGSNKLVIETPLGWEIIQYQKATLIAPLTYRLSGLLRGQFGTDAVMAGALSQGAKIVALDETVQMLPVNANTLGDQVSVHVGPVGQPRTQYGWQTIELPLRRIGDKPYAPVHVTVSKQDGFMRVNWIRRSRIGGDDWFAPEIPLGETTEKYRLSFFKTATATTPFKQVEVGQTFYDYPLNEDTQSRATGSIYGHIVQIGSQGIAGFRARFQLL